ncbi:uncharacterized protein [Elaeis guineensis]|uniref:uncharacterized protein n=1 Tax=Elaeis guineensis var. tenera TaxID=51953 RepID=UPI003C6D4A98
MDANAVQILAKGLKAYKRKDAATSGSAKKARVEETSLVVLAQAAIVVDAPSDVEPAVPRASSRSPLTEVPAPESRPEEASGVERKRRKKTVARKISSSRAAIEGSNGSEEDLGENPFNNRDLIKRLVDGYVLPEIVHRIVYADPEQRVWDSLGSFLEIGHQLIANIEAMKNTKKQPRQRKVARLRLLILRRRSSKSRISKRRSRRRNKLRQI